MQFMDYVEQPDDSTTVVKMVKELRRSLGKSPTKFSLSDNIFSRSQMSLNTSSNTSKSKKRVCPDNDLTTLSRTEKAEMLVTRSKLAKLEDNVQELQTEKKKLKIEEEKSRKISLLKMQKEQERNEALRTQIIKLSKERDKIVEEQQSLQQSYDEMKKCYEEKIKQLELENFNIKKKLCEHENSTESIISNLKDQIKRLTAEHRLNENSRIEIEGRLEVLQRRQKEANELMSAHSELKGRCENAEHKVKVLEENANRIDESAELMQKCQNELAQYRNLQKENKDLKEDNKLYRDAAENASILQEKVEYLQSKLHKAQNNIEKLRNLEFENERLKQKLEKWESDESYIGIGKALRSPGELTRMISELQKTQLTMIETQGELEASVQSRDSVIYTKEEECRNLHEATMELQTKTEQLEEQCQKLQRRLTLVSSDRDGLRRVLCSFEKEEPSANQKRIQECEETMQRYISQLSQLEEDLLQARQEASRERTLNLKLQLEHQKLKSQSLLPIVSASPSAKADKKDHLEISKLKQELADLQGQFDETKKQRDYLKFLYDRREMKGEYDPTKCRLLTMKNDPLKVKHKQYMESLENVHEENEKLRKKVIQLQQQNQDVLEESMNVSKLIQTSKPMEEAMKQVESEKKKLKRLEEQFFKKAQHFRIAVHDLLGYDIKETKDNTYKLKSIYSISPDDYFIFTCKRTKDGNTKTGMGETDFTNEWNHFIEEYMQNGDSIPSFLSAVTLELFNKSLEEMNSSKME